MKVKKANNNGSSKSSKINLKLFFATAGIVTFLVFALFVLWQNRNFIASPSGKEPVERELSEDISIPGQKDVMQESKSSPEEKTFTLEIDQPEAPAPVAPGTVASSQHDDTDFVNAPEFNHTPLNNTALNSPVTGANDKENSSFNNLCEITSNTVKNFYHHLDMQEYMNDYALEIPSEEHFTRLIQRLLDNPPVVSGEMNDLFTILQNTAHFFRIIGKDNILMLKGILDREKSQFEYVLADFYTLLHIPDCSSKSFSLDVPQKSLYDYAGFFLNTMGGRLYLFRRDSMSRMVVSYYAILLIDHANKNASNEHGIDILAHIELLIDEIESSVNNLLLKDKYLEKLYLLEEEYQ